MEDINVFLIEEMGFKTYQREYSYRGNVTIHSVYFDPARPMNRRDNMPKRVPNFLTWEGFGKLWEWAKKQEWWLEFIKEATYLDNTQDEIDADVLHMKKGIHDFIAPTTFAKAVADFLQKK